MIDAFTLLLSHAVILIAAWRLLSRDDLDRDPAPDADGTTDDA
jgi:hypothetical protein